MKKIIKLSVPALLLLACSSQAMSIKEVVKETINNNTEIQSSIINNQGTKMYIDEELGGYYPKVDLTANISKKRNKDTTTETRTGTNVQLDLEQLIYDGGLTLGKIGEAKHRYLSNNYANSNKKEGVLLNSIKSYLNLVQSNEKIALIKDSLNVYESYLKIARDNEAINGEALDKFQASAKVLTAKDKLLVQENANASALSQLEKQIGTKPNSLVCEPKIDTMSLPASAKVAIRESLKQNYLILEQIENINEQRMVLNQSDSANLPTLKFKLQGIKDSDLITNNVDSDIYTAKVELTYNLFNGGSDKAASQREKLFLMESQKVLDSVSNDIVSKVSISYNTYLTAEKRVEILEKNILDNKQILAIYKDQFESGTRSFIDVLNLEGDLFNSKISLVDAKYQLINAYYEVFSYLSKLEEQVLGSADQVCTEMNIDKSFTKEEEIKLEKL